MMLGKYMLTQLFLQARNMEDRMNLGVWWKIETIGDWTNALHGGPHLNRDLAIRLEMKKDPITNAELTLTPMLISLMLHDLSTVLKNTVNLIYY
jgi:hypothetical protein